ncbi:MAG TPA: AmmeMemoRadiSam system protein B [Candidatus Saccharimonadales bacterium]|nr:AmmeMemoRadiSam system protein B [Candidatus Saccharimonadales bacterium]
MVNLPPPRAPRIRTRVALTLLAAAVGLLTCTCQPRASTAARPGIRPPAVAGQFYPKDPGPLRAAVQAYLEHAVARRGGRPIALVLPHAGYPYSGQIAADGWRQVQGEDYDLVVILGTHHTVGDFGGAAVYPGTGFATPLGVMEVDTAAAAAWRAADPAVSADPAPHQGEHSIEVHVPFAQVVLPRAKLLPVVVGTEDPAICERLGRSLARVLAGRRVLLVASSDLSHYPDYDVAVASDRAVLAAIARLDPAGLHRTIAAQMGAGRAGLETCACGEGGVLVAMEAAKGLGANRGMVISCANSGDTPVGDRSRVVGYGAAELAAGDAGADTGALDRSAPAAAGAELGLEDKRQLLQLARRTLQQWFESGTVPLPRGFSPVASRNQGAFVTLLQRGQLRGCIGHMAEDLPLDQVVATMALAAAFEDPRFSPLQAGELADVEIEISALTPLERVSGPEAVVIGRDGVQIRKDGRVGVFLPQVPVEQGWDRPALMENLSLKAGLPRDAWQQGAEFYTFRSVMFRESEFR